jgi:hypothetical protein
MGLIKEFIIIMAFCLIFFFVVLSMADGPTLIQLSDGHYAAAPEIVVIERALIGILATLVSALIMFGVTRIFKGKDKDIDFKEYVKESLVRIEYKTDYLEKHTVKREDLIDLVRSELEYRDAR